MRFIDEAEIEVAAGHGGAGTRAIAAEEGRGTRPRRRVTRGDVVQAGDGHHRRPVLQNVVAVPRGVARTRAPARLRKPLRRRAHAALRRARGRPHVRGARRPAARMASRYCRSSSARFRQRSPSSHFSATPLLTTEAQSRSPSERDFLNLWSDLAKTRAQPASGSSGGFGKRAEKADKSVRPSTSIQRNKQPNSEATGSATSLGRMRNAGETMRGGNMPCSLSSARQANAIRRRLPAPFVWTTTSRSAKSRGSSSFHPSVR